VFARWDDVRFVRRVHSGRDRHGRVALCVVTVAVVTEKTLVVTLARTARI
jgi:hypothetical protein